MEDGLPNSAIRNILQDKKGYLWITTERGLTQFDGKTFRMFGRTDGITDSMNLEMLCATYDNNGNMWFGTSLGGLLKYDGRKFTQYTVKNGLLHNQVWSLYFDSLTQKLWIGTLKGISIFDGRNMQNFPGNSSLPDLQVRSIFKTSAGEFWFGTFYKGLVKYKNNSFEVFDDSNGFSSSTVIGIHSDPKNILWIITKKEIYKYLDGKFIDVSRMMQVPSQVIFNSVTFDSKENVWIGTRDGLFKYDHARLTKYTTDDGLAGDYINCVYSDNEGNLWAGTQEGLSVNRNNLFSVFGEAEGILKGNVNCVAKDKDNNLWITVNGLGVLKWNGKAFDNLTEYSRAFKNLNAKYILFDSKNKIWVCTSHLGILSSTDGIHFEREYFDTSVSNFQHVRYVKCFEDAQSKLWFSTYGAGVLMYDRNVLHRFQTPEICDNGINFINEDKNASIWIATNAGISKYKDGAFKNYQTSALTDTICRTIDFFRNDLIIGTNNGLMIIKNGITDEIKKENIKKIKLDPENRNGNEVTGTYLDKNNFLWIGTSNGLYRLNLEAYYSNDKTDLVYYGKQEGLKKIDFNSNFVEINNILYAGCSNSVIKFDPRKNSFNSIKTKTYINSIKLFLETVDWKNYSDSLQGNLPVNLTLPFNLNHLQFNFIGLCFTNPVKVKYRYILEGFDPNWSPETDKTDVTYSNIPPGDYTFKVISCNNTGLWNEVPSTFRFTIRPPFWKTKWFLSLVFLVVILSVAGYIKYKTGYQKGLNKLLEKTINLRTKQLFDEKNKLEKANIELEHAKNKAEDSEKVKELFLANMSHEIRTPMNSIIGMSHLLSETALENKQKKYVEAIKKSGENLLVIINDILDFSKINAGKIKLEKIPFTVEDILDNSRNIFGFISKEKNIELIIENSSPSTLTLVGDPYRLNQIIINLVGNAIKFTEKGFVRVKAEITEANNGKTRVLFVVSDSGVGIPPDKCEEIFQSFSQASGDTTRKYGGTGLGLTITKQLVELMGGKIWFESVEHAGTQFYVELEFPLFEGSAPKPILADNQKITFSKILLVEDNAFNQTVAIDNLNVLFPGTIVDIANNGVEALEMLNKNKYDVILMDIQMPVMDGIETTKILRSSGDDIKHIPVIALTAGATNDEIERYMNCGMNDYILKPFKRRDLEEKILKQFKGANS